MPVAAQRRISAHRRQVQAGTILRNGIGALSNRLAKGRGAHNGGRLIVLQGRDEHLGSGSGVLVAEHHHGQADFIGVRTILLTVAVVILGIEDQSFGQEQIRNGLKDVVPAAAVAAQVEQNALAVVFLAELDGFLKRFVRIGVERRQRDLQDTVVRELVFHIHNIHGAARQGDLHLFLTAQHSQGHVRALVAAHHGGDAGGIHALNFRAVDGVELIAHLQVGFARRAVGIDAREHHPSFRRIGGKGCADADIFAGIAFVHGFHRLRRHIEGIRIAQQRHHAGGRIVDQRILIYILHDVFSLDQRHDIGYFRIFLQRSIFVTGNRDRVALIHPRRRNGQQRSARSNHPRDQHQHQRIDDDGQRFFHYFNLRILIK